MAVIPIFQANEQLFRLQLSAMLEAVGLDGEGLPRLRLTPITTAEKDALTDIEGSLVYDSDLGKLCIGTAGGWETVTSA